MRKLLMFAAISIAGCPAAVESVPDPVPTPAVARFCDRWLATQAPSSGSSCTVTLWQDMKRTALATSRADVGSRTEWICFEDASGRASTTTSSYDANGQPRTIDVDRDGDGRVDRRSVGTYDKRGNLVRWDDDDDADGTVDDAFTVTYDDRGRQTASTNLAHGVAWARTVTVYSGATSTTRYFHIDGTDSETLVLRAESTLDVTFAPTETKTYSGAGKLTSLARRAAGRLTLVEDYSEISGALKRRVIYERRPDGLLRFGSEDADGDGTIDRVERCDLRSDDRVATFDVRDAAAHRTKGYAWSSDGTLASVDEWDVTTGRLLREWTFDGVCGALFLPLPNDRYVWDLGWSLQPTLNGWSDGTFACSS